MSDKKPQIQAAINTIAFFEDKEIRREWYNDERWFSVVDVVSILSDSKDGRKYRNKLKQRLKEEWSEMVTNCHQLKFLASDGKKYL